MERNIDNYRLNVAPLNDARVRERELIQQKYMRQREAKQEEETMRQSMQQKMYKSSVMATLQEQKQAKLK